MSDTPIFQDGGAPQDSGAPQEPCNKLDDNGDGRVDEGCVPGPNLRADQVWDDLGLFQLPYAPLPSPKHALILAPERSRALILARDLKAKTWLIWADRLIAPDHKSWLTPATWSSSANRGGVGLGLSSLVIAANPVIAPLSGTWTFGFARTGALPPQAQALPPQAQECVGGWMHLGAVSAPPLAEADAVLDLDIYLLGSLPFSKLQAPSSTLWKQIREHIDTILAPAGLSIGAVTFVDVLGKDGEKYRFIDDLGTTDAESEFAGLMKLSLSHRPTSTAVSIYLVQSLEANGVPVAAGLTGQLGGVAGLQGSRASGVVVAMPQDQIQKLLTADPSGQVAGAHFGRILAHELGHFLGLWHTVEQDGSMRDPLDDTADCQPAVGTKIFDAKTCPEAAKNLMFWTASATHLSEGQISTMRQHPSPRPAP